MPVLATAASRSPTAGPPKLPSRSRSEPRLLPSRAWPALSERRGSGDASAVTSARGIGCPSASLTCALRHLHRRATDGQSSAEGGFFRLTQGANKGRRACTPGASKNADQNSGGCPRPWTAALAAKKLGRRGINADLLALRKFVEEELDMSHEDKLREIFMKYDSDCNGFLSKDELPPLFKHLGLTLNNGRGGGPMTDRDLNACQTFIDRQFGLMDENGDGKISFSEFAQYYDRWFSMVDTLKNSTGPGNFRRAASNVSNVPDSP